MQGGTIQLLEGWRPLTEVTADEAWTLDNVGGLRDEILGRVRRRRCPPFFFASPPEGREPYPAARWGDLAAA